MSGTPVVSIIIVSYRTRDVLEACLRSLKECVDLAHEVIVVDNASPDGSADMVEQGFPHVRLVRGQENIGFSPANNLGVGIAVADLVMLLNPDTLVVKGSVEQWVAAHRRTAATISGPRLLYPDGSDQVSAWKVPGAWDAVLELFYLHRLFSRTYYRASELKQDREVGFVSGAAMLLERSVFMDVGGLDPELFWMEDTDLCVRIRQKGGSCYRLVEPGIIHIGGQSSGGDPTRMISNQLVSRVKFARKHRGVLTGAFVAVVIGLHICTRIIAFSLYGMFSHDPRASAYRHSLVKLGRYLFKGDRSI